MVSTGLPQRWICAEVEGTGSVIMFALLLILISRIVSGSAPLRASAADEPGARHLGNTVPTCMV